MYLEMVRPFVSFCTDTSHESKPQLEVRAWLRCPHCFSIADFTSTATILRPQDWQSNDEGDGKGEQPDTKTANLIQGLRHAAMTQLKQHRACDKCGIVSAWPKDDQAKGAKALDRMITLEWLRQRVEALTSCVPYKAKLGADVTRRIAKDIARERIAMGIE